MQIIKTNNEKETKDLAGKLAKNFMEGGIIALQGELGAGKTTFAQGFAQGLGIKSKIISPTFLIIRQYPIPNQKNFFYHIDLYRLEKVDIKSSGLDEIFSDPKNIVLIEWSERLRKEDFPKSTVVKIIKLPEDSREIRIDNKH